jgi:uncharacterized protein
MSAGPLPSAHCAACGAEDGAASEPPVASPCIDVCRMDEASGWCEGCLRTLHEIATWSLMDDAEKRAVNAQLPQRRRIACIPARPAEAAP